MFGPRIEHNIEVPYNAEFEDTSDDPGSGRTGVYSIVSFVFDLQSPRGVSVGPIYVSSFPLLLIIFLGVSPLSPRDPKSELRRSEKHHISCSEKKSDTES